MNAQFGPRPLDCTGEVTAERASPRLPPYQYARATSDKLAVSPAMTDIGSGAKSRPGVHQIGPLNRSEGKRENRREDDSPRSPSYEPPIGSPTASSQRDAATGPAKPSRLTVAIGLTELMSIQ